MVELFDSRFQAPCDLGPWGDGADLPAKMDGKFPVDIRQFFTVEWSCLVKTTLW